MGLLRSEPMSAGILALPGAERDARRYIEKLGKEGGVQFEDGNLKSVCPRPFRKAIQRIDEMERMVRFLHQDLGLSNCAVVKQKVDEFLRQDDDENNLNNRLKVEDVEKELKDLYGDLTARAEGNAQLANEACQTTEEYYVALRAQQLLGDGIAEKAAQQMLGNGMGEKANNDLTEKLTGGALSTLAGVVLNSDEMKLRLAIFRASRGNASIDFYAIPEAILDQKTGVSVEKSVFVVYFLGGREDTHMDSKLKKVCQAFGVNLYNWPKVSDTKGLVESLGAQRKEKQRAMEGYNEYQRAEIDRLLKPRVEGGNSLIEDWRLFCIKEKSIYTILNMCTEHNMTLQVHVWYPTASHQKVTELLQAAKSDDDAGATLIQEKESRALPPTFIRTNEYTDGWQGVIDTYGIPSYNEVNPGLVTVVTFPFIFGMMYGDIGHGGLLLLAGLWLCSKSETFRYSCPPLFEGRYMVLSMGIFATYAGFMYNDFFSVGLEMMQSRFVDKDSNGMYTPIYDTTNGCSREPENTGGPYPFGLDPAWTGASNELLFVNSLKMKLSVLFGVLQMSLGLIFRVCNAMGQSAKKNWVDFFLECIPMIVFMVCFFGWMDFMILYKWAYPVSPPPSIINSMICMAMGQPDQYQLADGTFAHNDFFPGSVVFSQKLMLASIIAVPIMLFPKPFVLLFQHKRRRGATPEGYISIEEGDGHGHGHGDEFEFGEVFIHQIIETIEYVLGTVSHTASYLRIWALSLAHQQLSLVFFQKTLSMGLDMADPEGSTQITAGIVLYFMFAAWFGVTLAVLLGMDVLECFLHTLRLHWVEFNSKFYKAQGYKFEPFHIKKLVSPGADE